MWRFAPMSGIVEGDITACSHEIVNRKQARPGPGQGVREGRHLRPRGALRDNTRVAAGWASFPCWPTRPYRGSMSTSPKCLVGRTAAKPANHPPQQGLGNYRVVRYATTGYC
jgi:hypothetical protein